MSVNNSLITKQHDRPFISMCSVVCARLVGGGGGGGGGRVDGVEERRGELEVAGPPSNVSHHPWDEFLHQCTLITPPRRSMRRTAEFFVELSGWKCFIITCFWIFIFLESLALPPPFPFPFFFFLLNCVFSMAKRVWWQIAINGRRACKCGRGDKCPTLCLVGS